MYNCRSNKNITKEDLSFHCGQALLSGKPFYVDNQRLTYEEDFDLIDDYTVVLKKDFLDNQDAGPHSFRLLTGRNEYASASFTVEDKPNFTIGNSPYKKLSGSSLVTAKSVDPDVYTAFGYSRSSDGSVIVQPASQTVSAGKKATFTVRATGGKLKYCWYSRADGTEDWTEIEGATSKTLVVEASLKNNGTEYRCVVTNDKGTATSEAARLTVTRPEGKLDTPVIVSVKEIVDGTGTSVVAKWNAVDFAEKYRAYRSSDKGDNWVTLGDTAGTSFTDNTVEKGKTYIYAVRCVSADGTSYTSDLSKPSEEVTVCGTVCTVTFETNGGSAVASQKVVKGQKAVRPDAPTKANCLFAGWLTDENLTAAFSFDTPITKNTKLYAKWAAIDFHMPAELTEIEDEAFVGGAFSAVELPEQLGKIGARAFADCSKLAYIYIPEATKTIAADAFDGVSGLTILCKAKSTAETYAKNKSINYVLVG